ncbi:metal-dependent hydrolase [Alcanivorax sp. HI0033]|uniref:metal-dependent hydrolase n=1 Tax=unclassified Alcanivorax TaxID=2638842 RepID=UPI0007B8FD54|nr:MULTISPECIES: metal-dependent hydrolase [unclassified Alcanivorax]KZX75193.1 metal-dependent hydrolase [Alcanivorax sp. HI0013]KZX78494.1 metal-dependent hydrolase [Alcanivorax sp. HI0011]KZY20996.1 metal-dependent hydrolase [Alcanivorax sp. HI0035]KZX71676.1 metal-dependent hydrolase [Alcanivorax sp. HI0003]KZX72948.1 metal-dependent hydrolase [Alcanivorax sp. HI0007]
MNATVPINQDKKRKGLIGTVRTVASKTPKNMIPKVRRPQFAFSEANDMPRYWWDNDPAKTLLLAALSASFPPGERFFIDSVRHYQDQITDPELKKAIKGFIGQEAHHSREHELMNGFLQERGVDLARLEREILGFMNLMRKYLSPERQLAHTVAVEHFTALMAEEFLLKYDALEQMDPRIAPIWAWHAIEESEHKAVAFDVYKAIGGSEFTRVTEMMVVSVLFPVFSAVHLVQLMKEDGQLGNMKSWLSGLNYMWGRPGVFRKLLPSYFKFYSPRFHPWDHDARDLVEKAKKKWLGDWG